MSSVVVNDEAAAAVNRRSRRRVAPSRPPRDEIPTRWLYSVRETCVLANMSPATFWRRVEEFELRRIGRRVFVTAESLDRFIANLPAAI